jgi:hypothetical protein
MLGSPPPRKLLAETLNWYVIKFNNLNKSSVYLNRKHKQESQIIQKWCQLAKEIDGKYFGSNDVVYKACLNEKGTKFKHSIISLVIITFVMRQGCSTMS